MFNLKDGDLDYLIGLYVEKEELQKFYKYERPASELIYKNTKYIKRGEFYSRNAVYTIPMDKSELNLNKFFKMYSLTNNEVINLNKSMFRKYSLIIIEYKNLDEYSLSAYKLKDFLELDKLVKDIKKMYGKEIDLGNVSLYINGYRYSLTDLIENLENKYNEYLEQKIKEEELKDLENKE